MASQLRQLWRRIEVLEKLHSNTNSEKAFISLADGLLSDLDPTARIFTPLDAAHLHSDAEVFIPSDGTCLQQQLTLGVEGGTFQELSHCVDDDTCQELYHGVDDGTCQHNLSHGVDEPTDQDNLSHGVDDGTCQDNLSRGVDDGICLHNLPHDVDDGTCQQQMSHGVDDGSGSDEVDCAALLSSSAPLIAGSEGSECNVAGAACGNLGWNFERMYACMSQTSDVDLWEMVPMNYRCIPQTCDAPLSAVTFFFKNTVLEAMWLTQDYWDGTLMSQLFAGTACFVVKTLAEQWHTIKRFKASKVQSLVGLMADKSLEIVHNLAAD